MFELHYDTCYNIRKILTPCKYTISRKGNNVVKYANIALSFDIETSSFYDSNNEKTACMYIYVIGINGKTTLGRTWEQFMQDIDLIKQYYNVSLKNRIIIYVHNLQYEFQFIRKRFNWEKVFCNEDRRPIYALTIDGIEFRCSYYLSNLSLEKVGNNLTKYKVKKLVGDLDYDLIRTSTTHMSDTELQYVINDGLVVMAYIQELIEEYNNDITRLPITNTGFIRQLCRKNCLEQDTKECSNYKYLIKKLTLTPLDYFHLKNAFWGGFTHASPLYSNSKVYKVASYDFTSSYPAVMLAEKFPMSSGTYIDNIHTLEDLQWYINSYCCLIDITFIGLYDKFIYDNYISGSKAIELTNPIYNNGRIASADKIRLLVTEVDLDIILKTYGYDKCYINSFTYYEKKYLPKLLVKTIIDLYQKKTTLKGVEGKEQEYQRSKGQLNSCYGMCVTDPCKDEVEYIDNLWCKDKIDIVSAIKHYNNSRSRFLFYPWGIWITAYARHNLWSAILTIKEDYVYSDTDSVKIKNAYKYKNYFEEYNKNITKKLEKTLMFYDLDVNLLRPKTKNGIEKPLGVWDYEGMYDCFKTLGAKRYIYNIGNELNITISGVAKKNGVEYLWYKYKNLNEIYLNFTDNLIFQGEYYNNGVKKNGNGKLTHTYIDYEKSGEVIDYLGNKGSYHEYSSIHMEICDYSINLNEAYVNYILGIKEEILY